MQAPEPAAPKVQPPKSTSARATLAAKKTRTPREPDPPAALPAPAPVPGDAPAAPNVGDGGAPGGVPGGILGGVVGGTGTEPRRLSDVAQPPALVHRVIPTYPRRARTMAVEGEVMLEVVLDTDGSVEDGARVVASIPVLDDAALAAVRQWRFRPARDRHGRPVRVLMEIPVRFVLQ